jgi:hypothetical protein
MGKCISPFVGWDGVPLVGMTSGITTISLFVVSLLPGRAIVKRRTKTGISSLAGVAKA